jgi:hypothetical protein
VLPGRLVDADLAPAAALPAAYEQRAATVVEVGLVEDLGLVDPQARAPENDDQAAQTGSRGVRRRLRA